jgi:P pilus assembly chaperone PapD
MFPSLLAASLALALTAGAGAASAQVGADLNISPRRVTFDESDRSASVYVFNQGDAPATYTVELVDRAMQVDGQIVLAAEVPAESRGRSAADYIQYTPRRVTLQPRESQVIRLRVRPPATGAANEYRTHLTVTALPPEDTGFTVDQAAAANADEVSLQVVALFSVSIPLILREGAVDARAGIDAVRRLPAQEGAPDGAIQLDLVRIGANSVYGDVEIYAGAGPAERLVALVRGIAVYPEIERRTVVAPLAEPLAEGVGLRIVYKDDDVDPGATLATMAVPGS